MLFQHSGQRKPPSYTGSAVVAAGGPVLLFCILACSGGPPVLRHDWTWIAGREDFIRSALISLVWDPRGIGSPRAYPTDYPLIAFDLPVSALFGTGAAFVALMFLVAFLCAYGALSLTRMASANAVSGIALATFALFNPWVYTKLVSGHLAMIAAYGASMALFGETLSEKPRWKIAGFFAAITSVQLQFFLVTFIFCALLGVVKRKYLPLVAATIVALPTVIGVLSNVSTLRRIPYNVDWMRSQSIMPGEGAALTGYFARYAFGFPAITFDAVWCFLAFAIIGAVSARAKRSAAFFSLLFLGAWIWAMGIHQPAPELYVSAVRLVPELEVYRELYDLIGFVAISYVALSAFAFARFPILSVPAAAASFVLVISWFIHPPSNWWVPLRDLPTVNVSATPQTRFALLPDVQPMRFKGRGSGTDPDAYSRRDGVDPLNGSGDVFPAAVALRQYALTGDTQNLSALSVSRIMQRPWLTSDAESLSGQLAIQSRDATVNRQGSDRELKAFPELAILDRLDLTALPPKLGSGAIFWTDAIDLAGPAVPAGWRNLGHMTPIRIQPGRLSAANGWVDVRQAFLAQPSLGQALGGVITTSPDSVLAVSAGDEILEWVNGTLVDQRGTIVLKDSGRYRWSRLPAGANGLRCFGECIIVGQGVPPSHEAASGGSKIEEVGFKAALPWIVYLTLPAANKTELLRYAVAFNPHWAALGGASLAHLQVESLFNGWIIPAHDRQLTLVLIEPICALQLALEALGMSLIVGLLITIIRGDRVFRKT